jgi:hypothetical protein
VMPEVFVLMANLPRFEIMRESEKLEKEIPSRFFFFAKRSALSRVTFPAFLLLRRSVLGASSPAVGAGATTRRGAALVTSSVSTPIGVAAPSEVAAAVTPLAGIPLLLDASSSGEVGAGAITRSGAAQVISSAAVSSASTAATTSVAAEREASPSRP